MKEYKIEYINVWGDVEIHYHKNYILANKNINKAIKMNHYELEKIKVYRYDYYDKKYYLLCWIKPKDNIYILGRRNKDE